MGNSPRDHGTGGQQLGFIFFWWGIVLGGEQFSPRTLSLFCPPPPTEDPIISGYATDIKVSGLES